MSPEISRKASLVDLALFGGQPSFAEPLHVGRPNLGNRARLLERINGVLDRRWLSNNGPCVQELESNIARMLGVRHSIAVANGTIALQIAIRAIGLTGEVLAPSFTFIATAHALEWQQIAPVFCDIDPRTHSLDPGVVERMITPRTSGIIGVHLWGEPCAVEELTAIAARHGLKLMFDASHAFNCSHGERMIGGFGAAEIFSFHATKYFNTFEGGAITTNDDELAERIRLMKNFGFAGYDQVVYVGTNGKMNEVSAAMGLTGLESLDEFIAVNRAHYRRYCALLEGLPGVSVFAIAETGRRNWQHVVLEVDERRSGIARDLLIRLLHAEGVLARRYFHPGCHRMEPYRSSFPHAGLLLPVTEEVCDRVVVLPTGSALTAEDVETICALVRFAIGNGAGITRRAG
jgi:dTDP-4-amino-4,6-dideoxygalactose transaminase